MDDLMEVTKAVDNDRAELKVFNDPGVINTMLPGANQGEAWTKPSKGSIPSDAVQLSAVQGDFIVTGRIIVKDNLNYNRVVIGDISKKDG